MSAAATARIAKVETFIASYAVHGHFKFFLTADGQPFRRETVLVKITDDTGHNGWGQSVPSPTWSYETIDTVRSTIDRHLAPALVGLDAFDTARIWRVMNAGKVTRPGRSRSAGPSIPAASTTWPPASPKRTRAAFVTST